MSVRRFPSFLTPLAAGREQFADSGTVRIKAIAVVPVAACEPAAQHFSLCSIEALTGSFTSRGPQVAGLVSDIAKHVSIKRRAPNGVFVLSSARRMVGFCIGKGCGHFIKTEVRKRLFHDSPLQWM